MTGLACWLVVVALVDLFRAGSDTATTRRRIALGGVGAAVVLGAAGSADHVGPWGWVAWSVSAVLLAGWVFGSGFALSGARRELGAAIAYGSLGLGVVVLGLAGARTGRLGWFADVVGNSALDHVRPERVLLCLAALLVQVSTANIVIRVLLDLVGVPAQDNEKTLRGGRVLGPMERLVIVGLGLGGSLAGATVVVAAKALLRFPELRAPRRGREAGASDVTEYFLIGSFASWMVAFACVGLTSV